MNKGFSLIECVVYILCITIIFGLLGEMVFRFYLRIDNDLKAIRRATNSFVCLNNVINDLCHAMSTEAVKKIEHDVILLSQATGDVTWGLNGDKLYRSYKKFGLNGERHHKTVSLMMQNVSKFDVVRYFHNNSRLTNSLSGFKIILKLDDMVNAFEHCVAIRGFCA